MNSPCGAHVASSMQRTTNRRVNGPSWRSARNSGMSTTSHCERGSIVSLHSSCNSSIAVSSGVNQRPALFLLMLPPGRHQRWQSGKTNEAGPVCTGSAPAAAAAAPPPAASTSSQQQQRDQQEQQQRRRRRMRSPQLRRRRTHQAERIWSLTFARSCKRDQALPATFQ